MKPTRPLVAPTTLVTGPRVPTRYFRTSGVGQSDVTVHAGSFHLALAAAGLAHANIMKYSSVLPAGAFEVQPATYEPVHGEVLECIMAEASSTTGERATAGLAWTTLVAADGKPVGGLVAEYTGPLDEPEARQHLRDMLDELQGAGWGHLARHRTHSQTASIVPDKAFGTAVVALAFTAYEVPVL